MRDIQAWIPVKTSASSKLSRRRLHIALGCSLREAHARRYPGERPGFAAANDWASRVQSPNGTGVPAPEKPPGGLGRIAGHNRAPRVAHAATAGFILSGVAVSVLVHALLVLWLVGSLPWPEEASPDEAIPVTLVEEIPDETPPPSPSQENAPPQDNAAGSPPSAQERREQSPAGAEEPAGPPRQRVARRDQAETGSAVPDTLGLASYSAPSTLTEDEMNRLRDQVTRCWTIPTGWTEPRQISVTIRFRLNRDGTLNGAPEVVQFPASELGKESAINALRAVERCSPFHLPADKYDQWKDVQLRFAP